MPPSPAGPPGSCPPPNARKVTHGQDSRPPGWPMTVAVEDKVCATDPKVP